MASRQRGSGDACVVRERARRGRVEDASGGEPVIRGAKGGMGDEETVAARAGGDDHALRLAHVEAAVAPRARAHGRARGGVRRRRRRCRQRRRRRARAPARRTRRSRFPGKSPRRIDLVPTRRAHHRPADGISLAARGPRRGRPSRRAGRFSRSGRRSSGDRWPRAAGPIGAQSSSRAASAVTPFRRRSTRSDSRCVGSWSARRSSVPSRRWGRREHELPRAPRAPARSRSIRPSRARRTRRWRAAGAAVRSRDRRARGR